MKIYDGQGYFGKYIDLRDSCLNDLETNKLDILYEYKDDFSLRDEIGMCPNIEVSIEVTDNSPFFIRPYHVKEDDRAVLDEEIVLFRDIEGRLFSLF